jgi:hypothetical protein
MGHFWCMIFREDRNTLLELGVEYRLQSQAVQNLQGTVFLHADKILVDESGLVGSVGSAALLEGCFQHSRLCGNGAHPCGRVSCGRHRDSLRFRRKNRSLSFGVEGGIRF